MKTSSLLPLVFAVSAFPALAQDASPITDPRDQVSYSIGANIGSSMRRDNVDLNLDLLFAGLKDSLSGGKLRLTPEEMQTAMTNFQKTMQEKMAAAKKEQGGAAKKEGEDFLAANKTKEGVQTLPSGLQYKVLAEGSGPQPKATDKVKVHYRGTLLNGTEFDSSYKRGQPAEFGVGQVIKGWTEALQLMKTGAKWQLFIPSDLAYGENGAGRDIPPNAVLIFEVELLSING